MTKKSIKAAFASATTVEAVKEAFVSLYGQVAPGSQTDYLYAEYEKAYNRCGDNHVDASGKAYKSKTLLPAKTIATIVAAVDLLEGVNLTVSGQMIIATGRTKTNRKSLKAMGFWYDDKTTTWKWYTQWPRKLAWSVSQLAQYATALANE